MLREEDLMVEHGRCTGGSFMRLVHVPTGIARMKGPLGKTNQHVLRRTWLKEIEVEIRAKGLTQYIVPDPIAPPWRVQS
jgi:hypothetical protein